VVLTRLQPDELLPSVPMTKHVPTTRTADGVVLASLPSTPDPDEIVPTWLPPAPAWYRGRREQWQIAKLNLERAYLDVDTTARADAAVHEATPAKRVYTDCFGQRWQEADTICGCWRCRGTSPQALAHRDALAHLRDVEAAVARVEASRGGVG
jgi:hypothetical protein